MARILLEYGRHARIRVLCTREIQRTIAESVHQLLRDQIIELGLEGFYHVTETEIKGKNGTQFYFAGLRKQDVAKIKSFEGVDIVWVEEAQVVSEESWRILTPTIRTAGSEIWITFNPELDSDPTWVRFIENPPENSILVKLNYLDNPWFPPVLEEERLEMQNRDPVAYDNIWEGNCRTSVEGAIYAGEIREAIESRRIRPLPYDPMLKVHCIWDLGWNDKMTIVMAQKAMSSLMVIDYIEDDHRTYASYVKELDERDYRYGKDFMPHDSKHKDPKYGKSHIDVMEELGRSVEVVDDIGVEAGIKLVRQGFGQVYFDDEKAKRLVHCLKRYRRQVNQNTNEPGAPLHDEFSHGADAFRYMHVAADSMTNEDVASSDPYAGFRKERRIV